LGVIRKKKRLKAVKNMQGRLVGMRICRRSAIAVDLLTNGINKGKVPFRNHKSIKLKGGSNPEITNIQGKSKRQKGHL